MRALFNTSRRDTEMVGMRTVAASAAAFLVLSFPGVASAQPEEPTLPPGIPTTEVVEPELEVVVPPPAGEAIVDAPAVAPPPADSSVSGGGSPAGAPQAPPPPPPPPPSVPDTSSGSGGAGVVEESLAPPVTTEVEIAEDTTPETPSGSGSLPPAGQQPQTAGGGSDDAGDQGSSNSVETVDEPQPPASQPQTSEGEQPAGSGAPAPASESEETAVVETTEEESGTDNGQGDSEDSPPTSGDNDPSGQEPVGDNSGTEDSPAPSGETDEQEIVEPVDIPEPAAADPGWEEILEQEAVEATTVTSVDEEEVLEQDTPSAKGGPSEDDQQPPADPDVHVVKNDNDTVTIVNNITKNTLNKLELDFDLDLDIDVDVNNITVQKYYLQPVGTDHVIEVVVPEHAKGHPLVLPRGWCEGYEGSYWAVSAAGSVSPLSGGFTANGGTFRVNGNCGYVEEEFRDVWIDGVGWVKDCKILGRHHDREVVECYNTYLHGRWNHDRFHVDSYKRNYVQGQAREGLPPEFGGYGKLGVTPDDSDTTDTAGAIIETDRRLQYAIALAVGVLVLGSGILILRHRRGRPNEGS